MTVETTREIKPYCNDYGDKFIELMNRCKVDRLPDVPEEEALIFLKELKRRKG